MTSLRRDRWWIVIALAFAAVIVMCPLLVFASQPCGVSPAAGGVTVLPNVLVIFDNSGSMTGYAHAGSYDPAATYAGIFDPAARYNYITSDGGYFEEAAGGAWRGNFLNWACMQRIDVARQIMTGGKMTTDGVYLTANNYTYYGVAIPYPTKTYTDTTNQTAYSGSGLYTYQYISNTTQDWGELRASNGSSTDYSIRIKVPPGYTPQGLLHEWEGKVRLGIMHFNGDSASSAQGGRIQQYVKKLTGAHLTNIVSDLNRNLGDDYDWSYTPLAETLYSATRYFAQVDPPPYYNSGDYAEAKGTLNDPLYNEDYTQIVWCAKNYVVLLTDGESTADTSIPAWLQNYDGDTCDPNPCGCPGYDPVGPTCPDPLNYDGTAYLDDVARYAHVTDLRPDTEAATPGLQNLTIHAVYMFGQPGWADVLLEKATDENHGDGIYSRAETADQITTALVAIFEQITQQAAAAASTAITSEPVSGVDMIYIPYYKHPSEQLWWGNIRAFNLDADGNLIDSGGSVATDDDGDFVLDDPVWDVSEELRVMNKSNREIFTSIAGNKEPFTVSNNALDKYFDVNWDGNALADETAEANALIAYIRGDDNAGGFTPSGFTFRGRDDFYMGDIMHSSPAFIGKPSARYDIVYGDTSYWTYYWNSTVQNRPAVLYAGSNEGMLHAFDATNGEELWTYIPHNLLPHLKWLADSDYCHCFYVDLSANVWDIKLSGDWKSVLVGGMRIGGTPNEVDTTEPSDGTADVTLRSALFALDVTNPNPNFFSVLWENNYEKFGYTISKPIPVKVGDEWYLVFGSGPKSRDGEGAPTAPGDGYTDNNGYIFIVDPNTGTVLREIDLGAGNFFGSPVAIDYDLDYSVDMIYIGDALGNLWRIKTFTEPGGTKIYAADQNGWIIDVDDTTPGVIDPLLSLGSDQPILMRPTVTMDKKGRVWIYVGTGRYFCPDDNQYCGNGNVCPTSGGCTQTEGAYGDRSKYMAVGVFDRYWYEDLVIPANSRFVLQTSTLDTSDLDHRVIVSGTVVGNAALTGYAIVDYTTGLIATDVLDQGWYFRLLEGKERCLGDFLLYRGVVFFISYVPAADTSDPCSPGGTSYLYGVNYLSGTSLLAPLFDLTGEGTVDAGDLVDIDGTRIYSPAIKRLDKAFAGGSPKAKGDNIYPPLPDGPEPINPPGEAPPTGVTSWKEVLM